MRYHTNIALPAARTAQQHTHAIEDSVADFMNGELLLGSSEYLFEALIQEVARTQSHRLQYNELALIITHETEQLTYENKELLIQKSQLTEIQKQYLMQKLEETSPGLDPEPIVGGPRAMVLAIKSAILRLVS